MDDISTRQEIERHQLAELNRLLVEVASSNPFWRQRIVDSGLSGGADSLEQFQNQMPLVRKTDLVADQHAHPPYGTNLTYPLERYTRFNQTSATSGSPLRWLDTPESWQWMLENWKRVHRAAGVRPADRVYFAFSFGPFLGFWTAFDAAAQLGCLCIPGGGCRSTGHLAALRDNQADILCCTPTYSMRLAEVARQEGIDLGDLNVRTILVAGEPGGSVPAIRDAIEREWPGASVFDHHGMTEVGPVSYQCPDKPGSLVIIEESYLAEIIDPASLKPVSRGEVGELVLTTLGRLGSPLLRYRTGDLVRQETVDCGTQGRPELLLAGGILGRADDMVVVRGVNVYPTAIADVCAGFPEIVEYRARLEMAGALRELQLDIELAESLADPEHVLRRLTATLKSRLSLTVPVTIQPSGSLPRFEMKANRWVRNDQ